MTAARKGGRLASRSASVAAARRAATHPRAARPANVRRGVRPFAVVSDPRSLPVAVFDSGVGGLTVLHECLVSLPHEDFLYLGDTARFPYGDRSAEELLGFARELAAILLERGAKALVVACNSATAAALPALRAELEQRLPVVGVVRPESRLAAEATRNGRVGLIATPATVSSGAYARALAETAPRAELHAVASAELAPLIQAGGDVDHRVLSCVEGACRPLKSAGVDTVILGCTHYPLVRPVLQRELGRGVTIVSSGEAIADEVETRLRNAGLENDEDRRGQYGFLATGDPEEFRRVGTRFLQLPIGKVENVDVTMPVRKRAA
jgi:glutamate racemase